jgi:hypothetical protein
MTPARRPEIGFIWDEKTTRTALEGSLAARRGPGLNALLQAPDARRLWCQFARELIDSGPKLAEHPLQSGGCIAIRALQ